MTKLTIGVVTSRFNEDVTSKLEEGALDYLESIPGVEVLAVRVPGAVEIPLACKALFDAGCEGVVALGAVIRGETTHYDVVCNSVERGVTSSCLRPASPSASESSRPKTTNKLWSAWAARTGTRGPKPPK